MMGLASGMDTDFIIQQTLRLHQFKIDNQMRNKKLIEWRQQTHNSIKNEITNLRQTFLSNLGSKSMMNRNVFNATKATVSGNSAGAVSIRTNAGSPLGNFSIQSVTQLAKGAHLTTARGASADGNGFATNAKLGDINFASGGAVTWTRVGGTVRVGNEDIKVERANGSDALTFKNSKGEDISAAWEGDKVTLTNSSGVTRTLNWDSVNNNFTEDRAGIFANTFAGAIPTIGDPTPRDLTITVNMSGDNPVFSSSAGTAMLEGDQLIVRVGSGDSMQYYELGTWDPDTRTVTKAGETTTLEQQTNQVVKLEGEADLIFNTGAGDVSVQIRANDSISEMLTRVNNSSAGVTMGYDRLTDQFTLESKLSTNSNPTESSLGIFSHSNFFNLIRAGSTEPIIGAGQQAIMTVSGGEVIRSNTNSFDFRGVGITLNSTFDSSNAGVDAIDVNLSRDATPAMNAIKEFIGVYNSIISKLEGLVNERKTGNEVSYKPLTDEEKSTMSDKQIEEWEAIAKKGILRNDSGLQSLVNSLRGSFFAEIEGMGISPSQIGLTTGSWFDGTGGQIMIDEERLRAAIERDPDMVADIFIKIDTSGGGTKGVGLLYKIDGLMRDYVNTSQSTSIKNLEDSLKRTNDMIAKMHERMFAEEDKLYRQFAAMESAMSKLQQQGDWFGAMLGGK